MKTFHKSVMVLSTLAILEANPLLAKSEILLARRSQVQIQHTEQLSSFRLPAPKGTYSVGTTAYYLVDFSRKEIYNSEIYDLQTQKPATTPRPTDRRELMVYIWYPAKSNPGTKTIPYIDEGFALATADGMGANFGVSPQEFVRLVTQTIQTNSVSKAELANDSKRYPVIIFSPSFGATPKLYTTQIEQLTSYGYVVVAVNPTYEVPVLFPDGRVITQSSAFDFSSADKETEQQTFNDAVEIRARDISFVLNELDRLKINDPQGLFTGRLDLSRVGIVGHSLGGDTAIEAMWRDRRLKAGINMDGGSYGTLLRSGNRNGLNRPFLVMSHDGADDALRSFYRRLTANAYRLTIEGSKHSTFMDFGLILPAFSANSKTQATSEIEQAIGSIAPQQASKIVNAYTLAFFNRYLKNKQEPLLEKASSNYPEALLESRP
jgi:dienelactone hydrolase